MKNDIIGRKIIEIGNNYFKLDNGIDIYSIKDMKKIEVE